ncbi:MAG: bacteriochlorophyll 4-vinyl reductase [Pseudomonadota bacterium]
MGPNAILQMAQVLSRVLGEDGAARLLARAGISALPDGSTMIPEKDAARLHQQVRRDAPNEAVEIATEAGVLTARYILAHRIPNPAQIVLKLLPPSLAARALSKAISKHAWTFAGSGAFRVVDPWTFEITNNPLIRGEHSETPICHWHAAVFAALYSELVAPGCRCIELSCGAQSGETACMFRILRPD